MRNGINFDFGGNVRWPCHLAANPPQILNRTFVFLSYEGLYLDQPTPQMYQYVSVQLHCDRMLRRLSSLPCKTFSRLRAPTWWMPTACQQDLSYAGFSDYSLRSHVNATSPFASIAFSARDSLCSFVTQTPRVTAKPGNYGRSPKNQVKKQDLHCRSHQPIVRIPKATNSGWDT